MYMKILLFDDTIRNCHNSRNMGWVEYIVVSPLIAKTAAMKFIKYYKVHS